MGLELIGQTARVPCEAKNCNNGRPGEATHIYGPECEALTGQLMYLCENHAQGILLWMGMHPNDPVDCPTHGTIGKVKDYLILKKM